jgi:hypothetical protein
MTVLKARNGRLARLARLIRVNWSNREARRHS